MGFGTFWYLKILGKHGKLRNAMRQNILVGGFNHLEKYESQPGWIIPCMMENKNHV
jgi:hypothetical protein